MSFRDLSINVNAAIAIVFALWSVAMLVAHRKAIPKTAYTLLLAFLVFLSSASVFWSVDKATTIVESLKFFNAASMFLLAFLFVQKKELTLRELATTIAASAVVPIVLGVFQLLTGGGVATLDVRGRIFGTFAHPNVFAFFLLSLMMLFYEYRIIALLTILLLFTYTRAAYIGAVLFFLTVGLVRAPKLVMKIVAGLIIVLAVAMSFNRVLLEHTDTDLARLPLVERIVARNDDADSFAWRLSVLEETIPIIYKRPILGYGFGTFAEVWEDNRGLQHLFDDSAEAHNDYLRMALELGLVGFLTYIALIFSLLVHSRKNLTLFAWILMFAIVSLSENMLHHTPVLSLTFAWWAAQLGNQHRL